MSDAKIKTLDELAAALERERARGRRVVLCHGVFDLLHPGHIRHLEAALEQWKKYAAAATAQYQPQLLTRVGFVDLNAITASVAKDVQIAQAW